MKSEFVTTNGIRMHYVRTGAGTHKPVLILAHGFSDDAHCWNLVLPALTPDYDVISIDARGHGLSDDPSAGYGQADHAHDLAGLIRVLNLDKPAVLGHSMGAVNALALAGLFPELVSRILLEDPPPFWNWASETNPDASRRSGMQRWAFGLKRKLHHEIVADGKAGNPDWADDEFEPWATAKMRMSVHVALSMDERNNLDWGAVLSHITCPVLLIKADPDRGGILTDDTAAALKACVPQTLVQHIANAGHSIRREQLENYMAVVKTFLVE